MYLLVAGFRFKNTPIKIREKFAFKHQDLSVALKIILEYPSIKEAIILSTCNRTEIYVVCEDTEVASGSIVRFLADYHQLELTDIRKHMFTLMHDDTVKQIFRVTSGLDSIIIGENQIIHQVKEALAIAQQENSIGVILDKLFKASLTTSKKLRSQTNISNIVTNISSAAIELAKDQVGEIENKSITILGAGKMANLALKYLIAKYEHKNISIINRTAKKIDLCCDDHKYPVEGFDQLTEKLKSTDILIVCTSAPHIIVKKEHIPENKQLLVVDISVPRNVDTSIASIQGVTLFNTDDLQVLVDKYEPIKYELIAQANAIIKEEIDNFSGWLVTQDVIPTIKKIYEKFEDIRKERIEQLRNKKCPYSSERCLIVEELSKQIVKTILHDPTVRIKSTKDHEDIYMAAKLLGELFDL